jgi:tripartite-type tricarboxylate transporter receptor subunit TctC
MIQFSRAALVAPATLAAGIAATAAMISVPAAALAQQGAAWPAKPLTMVVGYPAGSGIEMVTRVLADQLKDRLGQPVIIENRPGAIGNIAAQAVARAAPDGYTALYAPNSTHAANIHLYKDIGFHPVKDFAPVTTVVSHPFFLAVNPKTPVSSVAELTAYLKARPGKTQYGSGSATGLVAAELYRAMAALDSLHVPYKGMPQAYNDLLGGRLDFLFADSQLGYTFVRGGKIKALAATSGKRFSLWPDMPTMAESGFPGFDLSSWQAVFLPANTPRDIVVRLAQASNAAMATEKSKEAMKGLYVEPLPGTPESLAKLVQTEMEKWGRIIKDAGIQPE